MPEIEQNISETDYVEIVKELTEDHNVVRYIYSDQVDHDLVIIWELCGGTVQQVSRANGWLN